jgi:hypothetical protein
MDFGGQLIESLIFYVLGYRSGFMAFSFGTYFSSSITRGQ